MVHLKTIGMLEKNMKNDPTIKAHTIIQNGTIFTVLDKLTQFPADGTTVNPQTKDLYIALNISDGDNRYTEFNIEQDDYVNAFLLRAWDTQEIIFNEKHMTYDTGEDYNNIAVGAKLVAGPDGKFKTTSSPENYGIIFIVTEKVQFNGDAFTVKIVVS